MQKFRYILLIISIILLIIQLYMADYANFWTFTNLLNIVVPILLIISFAGSIRDVNKNGENK
ncbi:MAG: hypothetical protein R2812_06230 [Gelidibacter sp.]